MKMLQHSWVTVFFRLSYSNARFIRGELSVSSTYFVFVYFIIIFRHHCRRCRWFSLILFFFHRWSLLLLLLDLDLLLVLILIQGTCADVLDSLWLLFVNLFSSSFWPMSRFFPIYRLTGYKLLFMHETSITKLTFAIYVLEIGCIQRVRPYI